MLRAVYSKLSFPAFVIEAHRAVQSCMVVQQQGDDCYRTVLELEVVDLGYL